MAGPPPPQGTGSGRPSTTLALARRQAVDGRPEPVLGRLTRGPGMTIGPAVMAQGTEHGGSAGLLAAQRPATARQPHPSFHARQRRRPRLRRGGVAVRADPAAADPHARFRPGIVHHRRRAGADGRAVPEPAAGFHLIPDPAAADHAVAPVAQCRDHAADPVAWQRRNGGRRPCGRRVRRLPDGRRRGDRPDRVRHPAGGELHGHHQRLRPHRRGCRAVQPGCHAGQADGDRCRHVGRTDRRESGAPAPQGPGGRERLLRRHGRRREVRARRRDRRADHHGDQHPGRAGDRHDRARHGVLGCREDVHHADRGRWPGFANPRAAGLHRGRHRGDEGRDRRLRRRGAGAPAWRQPEAAGDGRRRGRGTGAVAGIAGVAVPGVGRAGGQRRMAALQASTAGARLRRGDGGRGADRTADRRTRCAWT